MIVIISKVVSVANAGVWQNFKCPPDVSFADHTLIFGFNGSGKTTLSRIFASVERNALEDRLPPECTFEIEVSDGTKIKSSSLKNPFGNNLLVFNSDFVRRNLRWDEGNADGIAYISEEKIDAHNEFKQIKPQLEHATEALEEAKKRAIEADGLLKKLSTDVARNVREIASQSGYTQAYDARKIKRRFADANYPEALILSDTDFKKNQAILEEREPLPSLNYNPRLPDGIVEWFTRASVLASESISQASAKAAEFHPNVLRWIETGLHLHDDHGVKDCLLCGNFFSTDRREHLRQIFDESWNIAISNVRAAIADGEKFQRDLRELYRSVPREDDLAAGVRSDWIELRSALLKKLENFGKSVREILELLKARDAYPTKEQGLPDSLSKAEIDQRTSELSAIADKAVLLIKSHNAVSLAFENSQKEAFERIETHALANHQERWDELKSKLHKAESDVQRFAVEEKRLRERHADLWNLLHDQGIGADRLNKLVWQYLGHDDIRLVSEKVGYSIVRRDGTPAKELSEGERTAISFSHFLTKLAADGRNLEDLVLVIDDPISSLDTAARTHAYSLMTRMTKKCRQLIVLTHNTGFMNMIKREFQNLQKRNKTEKVSSLLYLNCRSPNPNENRSTILENLHPLLTDYDSEYHYLFSIVREAAERKKSDKIFLLPNATRKLLEIFATFCSPTQSSFAGALGEHQQAIEGKVDVKALERLVQIESHGQIEGLGNLPVLTIEEAIRAAEAAMAFIKALSKDHHKKMTKACAPTDVVAA